MVWRWNRGWCSTCFCVHLPCQQQQNSGKASKRSGPSRFHRRFSQREQSLEGTMRASGHRVEAGSAGALAMAELSRPCTSQSRHSWYNTRSGMHEEMLSGTLFSMYANWQSCAWPAAVCKHDNSDRTYVFGCNEFTITQRADQSRAAPVYARVRITWRVAYC